MFHTDIFSIVFTLSFSLPLFLSLWFVCFFWARVCGCLTKFSCVCVFFSLVTTYINPEADLFVESTTVGLFKGWRWKSFGSMIWHFVLVMLLTHLFRSHFVSNDLSVAHSNTGFVIEHFCCWACDDCLWRWDFCWTSIFGTFDAWGGWFCCYQWKEIEPYIINFIQSSFYWQKRWSRNINTTFFFVHLDNSDKRHSTSNIKFQLDSFGIENFVFLEHFKLCANCLRYYCGSRISLHANIWVIWWLWAN